jgi:hypothetical protein
MRLPISSIRLDFQPPENLDEDSVDLYIEVLQRGGALPPVRVRFDGLNYFLEDGFHRVEAARRVGVDGIDADVLPGTLEDMEADFREYLQKLKASLRPQQK